MRRILSLLALSILATPVAAQSELDRMETAAETAAQAMEVFMVSRVPALADVMVPWEWDDELRQLGACTLDVVRGIGGDAMVSEYVSQMETYAAAEFNSLQSFSSNAPSIGIQHFEAIDAACQTATVSQRRMVESGLMDAMMQPEVIQALMGQ